MLRVEGFDDLFDRKRNDYINGEECFNAMNTDYEKAFGCKRYANYESYKSARSTRVNNKRSKK